MTDRRETRRVFISSTFRDMHAERDHLVKVVFPALRERLDRYRVDFIDIDLRWGITEEQAEDGRVLSLCLQQIDEARPFFIGLLGQRYGWVPDELPDEAVQEHEWVAGERTKSITELEILHGVLRDEAMHDRSYFYFRDPDALKPVPTETRHDVYEDTDSEKQEKLRRLKNRIRDSGLPMRTYHPEWDPKASSGPTGKEGRFRGLEEFGDKVFDDLWASIKEELQLPKDPPTETATTSLEQEKNFQERFTDNRLRGVTERIKKEVRPKLHEQLLDYALGEAVAPVRPMMVTGAAGSGKSTALARLARAVQKKIDNEGRGDLLVIPHFTGASPRSTSLRSTIERVVQTIGLAYGREYDTSVELRDLVATFHEALEEVPKPDHLLLIIDAVNQFDERDRAGRLTWLPTTLPKNVRVVLSTIDGEKKTTEAAEVAKRREYSIARAEPLTEEERQVIAREVPAIAAKTLSERQLSTLLSNPATKNPLFLRVALEELRGFGSFEDLGDKIASFPRPAGENDPVMEIFAQVIERLEADFERALVREVLRLLGSARRGLSEREMRELVVGPDSEETGNLYPMLRQLRPYLMRRGEVTDFFHDALRRAVRSRYLAGETEKQAAHERLADYFDGQQDFLTDGPPGERQSNARKTDELPHQLLEAEQAERLAEVLKTFPFLEAKAEAGQVTDLADDFAACRIRVGDDAAYVLRVLERAIRHDIGFLRRHPESLFQQLWNRAWWYDAPLSGQFFTLEKAPPRYEPPWDVASNKAHRLLESWREQRASHATAFPWVRRRTPPQDLYAAPHQVLRAHTSAVRSVAWSPQGDLLATASQEGSLKLWPPDGRGAPMEFSHSNGLRCFAWSPDGIQIATGTDVSERMMSGTGLVHIWNADGEGATVITFDEVEDRLGHQRVEVLHLTWSPDGSYVACVFQEAIALVYTSSLQVPPRILRAPQQHLFCAHAAWSPDGTYLTASSDDGVVRVWDSRAEAEPLTFEGHERYVDAVAWSPDGDRLASISYDGTARIWSLNGFEPPRVLPIHKPRRHKSEHPHLVRWSPDGKRLATAGEDRMVRVWTLDTHDDPFIIDGGGPPVSDIAWAPDGTSLACGFTNGIVRLWTDDGGDPRILDGHKGTVNEVAWSPDGKRLASASNDQTVRLWSSGEVGEPLVPVGHHGTSLQELEWAPQGGKITSASWDGTLRLWSRLNQFVPETLLAFGSDANARLARPAAHWSPDGSRVASGTEAGTLMVWRTGAWNSPEEWTSPGHVTGPTRWSPRGLRIASVRRNDGGAIVWTTNRPETPLIVLGEELLAPPIAWARDCKLLACTLKDGGVKVVDTNNGKVNATLVRHPKTPEEDKSRRHRRKLSDLAWAPDGQRLAGCWDGGSVQVWNVIEGGLPLVLCGDKGYGLRYHVVWSPDGRSVACGSESRESGHRTHKDVRVWNLSRNTARPSAPQTVFGPISRVFAPPTATWMCRCTDGATFVESSIPRQNRVLFEASNLQNISSHPKTAPIWAASDGSHVVVFSLEDITPTNACL